MARVVIVGAGQLGSRHLQALKAIGRPLEIDVVDPSERSRGVARERYESMPGTAGHRVSYHAQCPEGAADVAIVATSSDARREAVERLLEAGPVRTMVLEKLLFSRKEDYARIGERLARSGTRAWVNCPMRVMPPYERIRAERGAGRVDYRVTGSRFGLVTNAIHYIDHASHLTGCESFELDLAGLEREPIASKRAGFLELDGTLLARFADGSRCEMTCWPAGTAPVVVEIFDDRRRYVVRESEGRLWKCGEASNWAWTEEEARIPYQSEMTAGVVASLLEKGDCALAPYEASARIHLALLEPLRAWLGRAAPAGADYPFT
jgi:predicted dehydrogenase